MTDRTKERLVTRQVELGSFVFNEFSVGEGVEGSPAIVDKNLMFLDIGTEGINISSGNVRLRIIDVESAGRAVGILAVE